MGRPGQLDQRVTFQGKTMTPDGGGGNTTAWTDFATTPTVWAHVKPLRGTEIMREGGDVATADYRFTIRHRGDVSEVDRIVWGGTVYNIRQVHRVSAREMYLTIDAERGV